MHQDKDTLSVRMNALAHINNKQLGKGGSENIIMKLLRYHATLIMALKFRQNTLIQINNYFSINRHINLDLIDNQFYQTKQWISFVDDYFFQIDKIHKSDCMLLYKE